MLLVPIACACLFVGGVVNKCVKGFMLVLKRLTVGNSTLLQSALAAKNYPGMGFYYVVFALVLHRSNQLPTSEIIRQKQINPMKQVNGFPRFRNYPED